jgi:LacI family transcriptional regulator
MPVVLFDRTCMPDKFSTVIADGEKSAQMATQHFIDNGSHRIAFIGGPNHLDIVRRRKHGYLEALRANKIPIEKELVVCRKIDYQEGKIAAEQLLSLPNPPDAILAMNDTLALQQLMLSRVIISIFPTMLLSSDTLMRNMPIMWNLNCRQYAIKRVRWGSKLANCYYRR